MSSWKSWLFALCVACPVIAAPSGALAACATNEIDALGDGTQCETTKFSVTTTSDATTLIWTMTALGTFYADCGDGGTLTQSGRFTPSTISGNTITRTGTNSSTTYTCTWGSAGEHTVHFGGTATGYASTSSAAISFYKSSGGTQSKVASISGSLSAMFPVVNGNIPRFYRTFYNCSSLTSIPAGLFSGIDTSSATDTSSMFDGTFSNCSSLSSIPAGLFGTIDTSSATNTSNMFYNTFYNTGITSIPTDLFSTIDTSNSTNTSYMFQETFYNCDKLTDIPAGLFSTIDTSSATNTMCMFYGTFNNCSSLTGYIPPTAFPNTIKPGSSESGYMWKDAFYNTQLLTECPVGTEQYITGFESDWGGKVSCQTCADAGMFDMNGTCIEPKFSVTTTTLEADETVSFSISAAGEFYVDCGVDGVLSGTGVSGNVITRADTTNNTYTCTYSTGGDKTISFAGVASAYSNTDNVAAISFYSSSNGTQAKIAAISGSLGALFPTIGDGGNGNQPRFFETFRGASNFLGPIPATLFSGVTGAPVSRMFNGTFRSTGLRTAIPSGLFAGLDGAPTTELFANTWRNCLNMTGPIPEDLFAGIHGAPATKMFFGTFAANANDGGEGWAGENGKITGSIPAGLFAGISGAPAANMFHETFCGQSKLTGSIPENLFAGITGKPAQWMFGFTFNGCSGLTGGIPGNLFAGISGAPAASMFAFTFRYCSSLTGSIPENLFAGLDGAPAARMFRQTFASCSGLTGSIPENLFAGLNGAPQTYMFLQTFYRCSNLTGPIPSNLFAGVRGAPAYGMFTGTFGYCSKLSGAIPSDLFANISGAPAAEMFFGTFTGCSSLSGTLPASLFAGISGAPKSNMFTTTFAGCSSLSGYIPPTFFAGISQTTTLDDQMTNVFNNSGLDTECPDGMTQYMTGFEDFFTGKVSCEIVCDNGYHSDNNMCVGNPISIIWSDTTAEDIDATGAGTAVYGGDVKTPVAAIYKPGKIFRGWVFNKPDIYGGGE